MKDDGNCFIAGASEAFGGDSETHLNVFEDALNNVSEMFDSYGFENDLSEGGNTKMLYLHRRYCISSVLNSRMFVIPRSFLNL